MSRYYVRREECWGGTHVYAVFDGDTRARVSKWVHDERTAQRRADRMNTDLKRYLVKRTSEFATP